MSDISINPSQDPQFTQPVTTGSPSGSSTVSGEITDTQAAAIAAAEANPLSVFNMLTKPVYINVWSETINTALQNSKKQISSDLILDATLLKGMRQDAIQTAEDLLALQTLLTNIADQMAALYEQQLTDAQNANNAVDTYNNQITQQTAEDQSQIDTMNAATDAYNASDQGPEATATYNAAIDNYNTYVNSTRVTAHNNSESELNTSLDNYQAAIVQQNATIDQINILNAQAGIPPMPYVTDPSPSVPPQATMPTAPTSSSPTYLPDANVPDPVSYVSDPIVPPTSQDLINQYAGPLMDAVMASLAQTGAYYDQLTAFRDFEAYYLGPLAGKISFLPASFIDRATQVFMDQSVSVGSGAGVSLSSMISGLSNINLNRILSNGIATDAAIQAQIPLSPRQIDEARLISLLLLSRAALGSGVPAFSLLADRLAFMDQNSPTVKIALGASFLNQIIGASASDDLRTSILSRLTAANASADPAQLDKLADQLTAALKLSQLLFSLSVVSQTLNSPELTGQLLARIDSPAIEKAAKSAAATTFSDILNNPLSLSYLKADLANTLAGTGTFSQSTADGILKALNLSQVNQEADLKASVTQQLIAQGVPSTEANTLADRAAGFIRAEIDGANLLDTAVKKDQQKHDNLLNELTKRNIPPQTAELVATNTANDTFTSRRELRESLATNLVNAGIPINEARHIGSEIVRGNESGVLSPPAVTDAELSASISARIISQTTPDLGNTQAQQLASQVVAALFGSEHTPLSVTGQIQAQVTALNAADDTRVASQIREFLKPNYDLFQFNQRIMDPANTLVLSMWTGVMYSSKFKHTESIDIIV